MVEAALNEGALNTSMVLTPAQIPVLIAAFNEKYPGINVTNNRPVTSVAGAKEVDEMMNQGQLAYDLVTFSDFTWAAKTSGEGKVVGPSGPALQEGWDKSDFVNDVSVPINATPVVLSYNTDLVKEAPKSWDTLATPEYAGKTGVILQNGSEAVVALYDFFAQKVDPVYAQTLAGLSPRIYQNTGATVQGVASGEVAWANFGTAADIQTLQQQGAPIAYTVPEEGTTAWTNYVSVFKDAKHKNAALLFLDFLMSSEGQTILTQGGNSFSYIGVPGSFDVDPKAIRFPRPEDGVQENRTAAIDQFKQLFGT